MQPGKPIDVRDALVIAALLFFAPQTASATAEYDTGSDAPTERSTPPLAPRLIPPQQPSRLNKIEPARINATEPARQNAVDSTADEEAPAQPPEASQSNIMDGVANPAIPPASTPGQPTYSIRLPLGVPGSIIPKLHTPAPASPPSSAFLPAPASSEYSRPVAWRATAEGIRNLPAASNLLITTVAADFKATYNAIAQESQATGWNLTSLSLPAGHFLVRIPKNDSDSRDDAAAWLIMVASPIDSASTELRVKIQARRASTFSPAVNSFLQRCQMRASGNKLL